MIEVYITNIENQIQASIISKEVQKNNTDFKINIDFQETDLPFPCGHSILRIEGDNINSENIIVTVSNLGYRCEILEDKICK